MTFRQDTQSGTRTSPRAVEPAPSRTTINRSDPNCPAGWITRAQLIERTGLTEGELRKFRPKASRSSTGWMIYPERYVNQILAKIPAKDRVLPLGYDAEQSQNVFRMLKEGRELRDVVIETGILPDVLDEIIKAYERLTSTIFLSKATVDRLSALFVVNFPIDGEDALMDVVEAASSEHKCIRCKARQGRICMGCSRQEQAKVGNEDQAEGCQDQR
jgi:hypothetical protein